jgi:hypothetical protein
MEDFKNHTTDSQIINKYIIIGLFQEVSHHIFDIVENYLQYSVLRFADVTVREEFTRFLLFTFESLTLIAVDEEIECTNII